MAINAQVERAANESPTSLIRRFSKKVQGLGLVQEVRGRRYQGRNPSKLAKKKKALGLLSRRAKYEHLLKLGKIVERKGKRNHKQLR